MQKAGQKNNGAWMRANRRLWTLTQDERDSLKAALLQKESVTAAFNAIRAYQLAQGLPNSVMSFQTAEEWITQLLQTGFPKQIWMGRPLHDRQVWINPGEPVKKYRGALAGSLRAAGGDIRFVVTEFFRSRDEVLDALNQEVSRHRNVGGRAGARNPDAS